MILPLTPSIRHELYPKTQKKLKARGIGQCESTTCLTIDLREGLSAYEKIREPI